MTAKQQDKLGDLLTVAIDGIKVKSHENSRAIIHHADPKETLKAIYDLEQVYMTIPDKIEDYDEQDQTDNEKVLKRVMMNRRNDLRDPEEVQYDTLKDWNLSVLNLPTHDLDVLKFTQDTIKELDRDDKANLSKACSLLHRSFSALKNDIEDYYTTTCKQE